MAPVLILRASDNTARRWAPNAVLKFILVARSDGLPTPQPSGTAPAGRTANPSRGVESLSVRRASNASPALFV